MTQFCDWPISYVSCTGTEDGTPKVLADMTPAQRKAIEQEAAEYLWNATNRLFGVCEAEVRPCRAEPGDIAGSTYWGRGPGFDPGFPRSGGGWRPVLIGGSWFNLTCGCVSGGCSCLTEGPSAISLPGPVVSVTTVMIDGVVIPSTAYRVDHKRLLVRTDGGTWPATQDMLANPDAQGAFTVTYMRGVEVPTGGQRAAGLLARELALEACGDNDCALPENWATLTRQGITITAPEPPEAGAMPKTGIRQIDAWVSSVTQPVHYAGVRSVDLPNLR